MKSVVNVILGFGTRGASARGIRNGDASTEERRRTQKLSPRRCVTGIRSFCVLLCLSADVVWNGPRAAGAGSRQFGAKTVLTFLDRIARATPVLTLARRGSPKSSVVFNSVVSSCRCGGPHARNASELAEVFQPAANKLPRRSQWKRCQEPFPLRG